MKTVKKVTTANKAQKVFKVVNTRQPVSARVRVRCLKAEPAEFQHAEQQVEKEAMQERPQVTAKTDETEQARPQTAVLAAI